MLHQPEIARTFKLHIRCTNCLRDGFRRLEVPDCDGAPRDVDELVGSAFLERVQFSCGCGNVIGQLIGVNGPMPA